MKVRWLMLGMCTAIGVAVATPVQSAIVITTNMGGADADSFTLDSEVSRFLPKPFTQKDNLDADSVTILRGNGKSG